MNTVASSTAGGVLGTFSKAKTKLVQLLLEERSRQQQKIKRYPRAEGMASAGLPTSWSQQRLWFLDQLGGGHAYEISAALSLEGELNESALRAALDGIVERHEVLRTVFGSVEGRAVQVIEAVRPFALEVTDLSGQEHAREQIGQQLSEEWQKGFDLSRGP